MSNPLHKTKPIRTQGLSLSLMLLLVLLLGGCDQLAELLDPKPKPGEWHYYGNSPYPVMDTGVPGRDWNLFWLDNYNVLFEGFTKSELPERELWRSIVIYNVTTRTLRIHKKNSHGGLCYTGEYIKYTALPEDILEVSFSMPEHTIFYSGDYPNEIGKKSTGAAIAEAKKNIRKPNIGKYSDFLCRSYQEDEYIGANTNRQITPLKKEHGYLDLGPDDGKIESDDLVTYYPKGAVEGVKLDLTRAYSRIEYWSDYKNAYYFQKLPGNYSKHQWKKNNCAPVHYLYPDKLEAEKVCVPFYNLERRHSAPLLFPIKQGHAFVSHDNARKHKPGEGGLYILTNSFKGRIIAGQVKAGVTHLPVVSPDGCKIAFVHVNTIDEHAKNKGKTTTLKIADICRSKSS